MRVVKTKQMVPRARGPLGGGLPTPANPWRTAESRRKIPWASG